MDNSHFSSMINDFRQGIFGALNEKKEELLKEGRKVYNLSVGTPEDLALDGTLSYYFARPGIAFDPSSGLFRVDNPCTRCVRLIGEGVRAEMIKKALRRNGVEAGGEVLSDVCVVADDGRYFLTSPGRAPFETRSVEETVRLLLTSFS